jgi:hypothetical protein
MDFFTVPTLTGRMRFVLVLLAHHRRRVVPLAITDHPTAAWTAQQVIEAFPRTAMANKVRLVVFLAFWSMQGRGVT